MTASPAVLLSTPQVTVLDVPAYSPCVPACSPAVPGFLLTVLGGQRKGNVISDVG